MDNKKVAGIYAVVWVAVVALYNIIVFAIPEKINDVSRFTGMFWAGYVLMMLLFVVQAVTTFLAFRKLGPGKSLLFRLPLLKTSIGSIVIIFPISVLFMIFPNTPTWIGVILIAIIVFATVIMFARAALLPAVVEGVENKVRAASVFIRSNTAELEGLLGTSDKDAINKNIETVYEAFKYSDPISIDELTSLETNITEELIVFKDAIKDGNEEKIDKQTKLITTLLNQRNAKVKALK